MPDGRTSGILAPGGLAMSRTLIFAALLASGCTTAGAAQPVTNPTQLLFVSEDHASLVDSYVLEYWLASSSSQVPVVSVLVPKAQVAPTGSGRWAISLSTLARPPVGNQRYVIRIRAVSGGGVSGRSLPSNVLRFRR